MAVKGKKAKVKKYAPADIVKLVEDKRADQGFTDLLTQMEEDFDLFALEEYDAPDDHISYTSPAPKNDFMKVFHGINKSQLVWRIIVPDDAEKDERDSANEGEALLTGILTQADRTLKKIGEPPLRDSLAWIACARGMLGLNCLIYTNKADETVVDIRATDPMHMAWEAGADGLIWKAFIYKISKAEALDRYDFPLQEDSAIIIDFFDKNINAVVLQSGGENFVKDPTAHELGHVPGFIGFAGGMPTIFTREYESTMKHRAASVYSASRGVYEPHNKQISFIMDVAEKSVAGTLVYETESGTKGIKGDPFGSWQVVQTKIGEKLVALEPPRVPQESSIILSVLDRDKQESSIPFPIGYGLDPQAHSGAALSMMNDNTRSVYGPFTALMEDAYTWLCEEILAQFKAKGKKMPLKGFDSQGKFFIMDAQPSKIKPDWYISVTCEPKLPRDESGELQMALAATQPRQPYGRPLISDYTAWEKFIKLQNPDAEDTRIEEQQVRRMIEQMPNIQIRRLAMELLNKGDKEGAMELMASMPPPGGQQGQPQPGQGQPQPGQGQPQPGQGQPQPGQGQQGIPPDAQQILMQLSQQLGIPPDQLAQMPKEQVEGLIQQMMASQGGQMQQQMGR